LPGSRHTTLAYNDGRKSEQAIVVEGSGGTNTEALFMHRNRGRVIIEGEQTQALALRRSAAPAAAQPTL
jgi:hypothetical protein